MDTHIQQKIMKDIQHLDSFQLSEVLDFVDFLSHKTKAVSPEPDIIDSYVVYIRSVCQAVRNLRTASRKRSRKRKQSGSKSNYASEGKSNNRNLSKGKTSSS